MKGGRLQTTKKKYPSHLPQKVTGKSENAHGTTTRVQSQSRHTALQIKESLPCKDHEDSLVDEGQRRTSLRRARTLATDSALQSSCPVHSVRRPPGRLCPLSNTCRLAPTWPLQAQRPQCGQDKRDNHLVLDTRHMSSPSLDL